MANYPKRGDCSYICMYVGMFMPIFEKEHSFIENMPHLRSRSPRSVPKSHPDQMPREGLLIYLSIMNMLIRPASAYSTAKQQLKITSALGIFYLPSFYLRLLLIVGFCPIWACLPSGSGRVLNVPIQSRLMTVGGEGGFSPATSRVQPSPIWQFQPTYSLIFKLII
jgi:hypothetical protein